ERDGGPPQQLAAESPRRARRARRAGHAAGRSSRGGPAAGTDNVGEGSAAGAGRGVRDGQRKRGITGGPGLARWSPHRHCLNPEVRPWLSPARAIAILPQPPGNSNDLPAVTVPLSRAFRQSDPQEIRPAGLSADTRPIHVPRKSASLGRSAAKYQLTWVNTAL